MTDIRKIRRLKDYSQEYMAYQLEITQKAYSDLENGKVRMKLKTMKKLSEILEVPLNTLCPISYHCEVELGSVITKLVKILKEHQIAVPQDITAFLEEKGII